MVDFAAETTMVQATVVQGGIYPTGIVSEYDLATIAGSVAVVE